uniref:Uncharacterized protein n=1 Tax=Arundo donax TaxID=35708 RepID=A0A0A9C0R8_ARUDO
MRCWAESTRVVVRKHQFKVT